MVSIRSTKYKSLKICTGSIITKFLVLSAAHCVVGKNKEDFFILANSMFSTVGNSLNKHEVEIFIFNYKFKFKDGVKYFLKENSKALERLLGRIN